MATRLGILAASFLLAVGLASCSDASIPANTPTPPSVQPILSPTASSTAELSPTPSSTPSPTSTPTPPACLAQGGETLAAVAEGRAFSRAIPYRLYLPPCYGQNAGERFPTIYLLHGFSHSEEQWIELGIAEVADALIASDQIPPIIMVMPGWDNRVETEGNIVEGLVPLIEENTLALPGRFWRAIGGISRGAGWAWRIAVKYPETFASLGLHSPGLTVLEQFAVSQWAGAVPRDLFPRVWIDIGEQDSLLAPAVQLSEDLDALNIPYTWLQGPGGHKDEYWRSHLEEYLRWYTEPWLPSEQPATSQPSDPWQAP